MTTKTNPQVPIDSFEIIKTVEIAAPIELAFEAVLEQIGPDNQMPDGKPFPFKVEPWPGGRWFRDLGNNTGHLWGHVQVIKPPTLLEICGPLMMSNAAFNHVQYRLKAEGGVTQLVLTHRAAGLLQPGLQDGMNQGWGDWVTRIRDVAQRKAAK